MVPLRCGFRRHDRATSGATARESATLSTRHRGSRRRGGCPTVLASADRIHTLTDLGTEPPVMIEGPQEPCAVALRLRFHDDAGLIWRGSSSLRGLRPPASRLDTTDAGPGECQLRSACRCSLHLASRPSPLIRQARRRNQSHFQHSPACKRLPWSPPPYLPGTAVNIQYRYAPTRGVCAGQRESSAITSTVR